MVAQALQDLASFFTRSPVAVLIDVVDIGIVAFLFYRTLVLIRGTRAMQMALGLVLIFVTYQLARRLGLVAVRTLLDSVITYVVLVVVIIFQADIRRALMRFGQHPLWRAQRDEQAEVVEEVIAAAQSLSKKRVGALIVIEKSASLDEFLEQGVEIDAKVSRELLFSVFIPSFENPIHDGATVIRNGRVWQSGTFLPLSTNVDLDRSLGTRHRAAMGITEETDAVVVVVSEERGAIAVCSGGEMYTQLGARELREHLLGSHVAPARQGIHKWMDPQRWRFPAKPTAVAERQSNPTAVGPISDPKPAERVLEP